MKETQFKSMRDSGTRRRVSDKWFIINNLRRPSDRPAVSHVGQIFEN